ncbi:hypothetical protein [Nakamurella leprariae]|uniref:Septum formation-related domain-containing protein n=1 Tax=Nakamurella leprariae TaxID=2803911 RepID=A0A939C2V5_9ACTN|nr:hypothetical protein [Nakamurella leprariae]MBM9468492.1 hypothetical protein [Nakamurella leprariae]
MHPHGRPGGRAAGATLLLSVVAALLLSGVEHTVPGRAIPAPGMPVVGQCVAQLTRLYEALVREQPTSGPVVGAFPSATPAPCDDRSVGLVIGRSFGTTLPETVDSARYVRMSGMSCASREAVWRSGRRLTPMLDLRDRAGLIWQPATVIGVLLVGPMAPARAAGQQWTACVVVPDRGAGAPVPTLTADRPSDLAVCRARSDTGAWQPVRCTAPHEAEVIARLIGNGDSDDRTGDSGGDPDGGAAPRDQVLASCADQVRHRTGLADPTAGGALQLSLEPPPTAGGLADCMVTAGGGRRLTDTLVGVGDGPLPLTG